MRRVEAELLCPEGLVLDGVLSVTATSKDDCMAGVLVDSCGWISLVEAGVNFDMAITETIGDADIWITKGVRKELDMIATTKRGLLLEILYSRSKEVEDERGGHPDDELFRLSVLNSWPVITVDKDLKRRLIGSGGSYIEVTSGKRLRLIER